MTTSPRPATAATSSPQTTSPATTDESSAAKQWALGVPCWVDLMANEPAIVRPFYEAVLGWSFTDPDDQFGGYVMALLDGRPVAGLGPSVPGARAAWTMYIASGDIDHTAAAITQAGGQLLRPVDAVGDLGRMVVAMDPTGATFGVWEPGTFGGVAVANAPGALFWEDLRSPDPDLARTFYAAVFAYDYEAVDMAPDDYTTFSLAGEGEPRGGIGGFMGAAEGAPHWLLTFGTGDLDAALAAAAHGGSLSQPITDSPYGRMAGVIDPSGAEFWLVEATA